MATPIMVSITGSLLEWPGVPDGTAELVFERTEYLRHSDGTVIEPGSLTVETSSDGSVSFSLMATTDPNWSPLGWTYRVIVKANPALPQYRFSLSVPHDAPGGILTLGELLPSSTVVPGTLYAGIGHTHLGYVSPSDLTSGLAGKANTSHSHVVGDVTGLSSALSTKADLVGGVVPSIQLPPPVTKADIGLGNVDNVSAANLRDRSTHTGTQSADTLTDGSTNRLFSSAEKTKLTGIATGATANSSDVVLLARANHTGTQVSSTISDFSTAVDARITAAAANTPWPVDYGWISWNLDLKSAAAGAAMVLGTLYLVRIPLRQAQTITGGVVNCSATGAPTTFEASFFTPDGTRRALSGNLASLFATTGLKSLLFSSSYGFTPSGIPWGWLGLLAVGGTPPSLTRCETVNSAFLNPGISASSYFFGSNGTGLTATPASITPASNTAPNVTNDNWWVAATG